MTEISESTNIMELFEAFLSESAANEEEMTCHFMYDALSPITKETAASQSKMMKVLRLMAGVTQTRPNIDVLQDDIIGNWLVITPDQQKGIMEAIGLTWAEHTTVSGRHRSMNESEAAFDESPRYKNVAGLKDQFVFAAPLISLASELEKAGKHTDAMRVYYFAFLKPYASKISQQFPLKLTGVGEDRMRYTMAHLGDRFDLKKMGSVEAALMDKAVESFENYRPQMTSHKTTDNEMWIIFSSGIYSRAWSMILSIQNAWMQNKDNYIKYANAQIYKDDETDEEEVAENNTSISAIRTQTLQKVMSKLTRQPIDAECISLACKSCFRGSTSAIYTVSMKTFLDNAMSGRYKDICRLLDYMLTAWFSSKDRQGRYHKADGIRSESFVVEMKRPFTSPNTHDDVMIEIRNLIKDLMNDCSDKFNGGTASLNATYLREYQNAAYVYFCYYIMSSM